MQSSSNAKREAQNTLLSWGEERVKESYPETFFSLNLNNNCSNLKCHSPEHSLCINTAKITISHYLHKFVCLSFNYSSVISKQWESHCFQTIPRNAHLLLFSLDHWFPRNKWWHHLKYLAIYEQRDIPGNTAFRHLHILRSLNKDFNWSAWIPQNYLLK